MFRLMLLFVCVLFVTSVIFTLWIVNRMVFRHRKLATRPFPDREKCRTVMARIYDKELIYGDSSLPAGSPGSHDYWQCGYAYNIETRRGVKQKLYKCQTLGKPEPELELVLVNGTAYGPMERTALISESYIESPSESSVDKRMVYLALLPVLVGFAGILLIWFAGRMA